MATVNFIKVKDARNRPVRGLWRLGDRFYAQLRVNGKQTRAPLRDEHGNEPATVPAAVELYHLLLRQRKQQCLPVLKKSPSLAEYVQHYLDWCKSTKDAATHLREQSLLKYWVDFIGGKRIAQINAGDLNDFAVWRKDRFLKERQRPLSNRSINLSFQALNNCLNKAKAAGYIQRLPEVSRLEDKPEVRPLWDAADIERLVAEALSSVEGEPKYENGDLYADFVRFCTASGARHEEALGCKWSDVDFARGQLRLTGKFSKTRWVDFNEQLEAHLKSMEARRTPSEYLFPTPRGEGKDKPIQRFYGTHDRVREATGLKVKIHDFRHYFISHCVMAGIDYMTIARWVGHSDGGVLIGRVYGHLDNAHTKKQASRVFQTQKPQTPAPAPVAPAQVSLSSEQLQQLMAQAIAQALEKKAA